MSSTTRRLFIVASLLFVFVGGASAVLAKSIKPGYFPPFTIRDDAIAESEYWELVEQSHQTVSSLKGKPTAEIKRELAGLVGKWETAGMVQLDDGQVITLDNSYLLSTLNAEQPDIDHILELLDALQTAHKEYPSGIFTPDDLVPLQEILSRPEFQWQEQGPNPVQEFFQRLIHQLFRWLDKIFGNREASAGGLWSPFYTIAAVTLVIVLLFVFRTLFADFISEARAIEENMAEEALTSEAAFEKAQMLSRGGDYRLAVRYLYLSSLLLLDERGLLRYDRSKTNREYLRSVSASPDLAEPLGEVIEVFDDVWYGYHSLDENTFKHYSDRVEELKEKK